MKVTVISGQHEGLTGTVEGDLAERRKTLGREGKITLWFLRKGLQNTMSIRIKHLESAEQSELFIGLVQIPAPRKQAINAKGLGRK